MGLDGMYTQVLREQEDDVAKPLPIISEVPNDWTKDKVSLIFRNSMKDPGNYWPVSLTSIPGKVMEQNILEVSTRMQKKRRSSGAVSRNFPGGNHA